MITCDKQAHGFFLPGMRTANAANDETVASVTTPFQPHCGSIKLPNAGTVVASCAGMVRIAATLLSGLSVCPLLPARVRLFIETIPTMMPLIEEKTPEVLNRKKKR